MHACCHAEQLNACVPSKAYRRFNVSAQLWRGKPNERAIKVQRFCKVRSELSL